MVVSLHLFCPPNSSSCSESEKELTTVAVRSHRGPMACGSSSCIYRYRHSDVIDLFRNQTNWNCVVFHVKWNWRMLY